MRGRWNQQIKSVTAERVVQIQIVDGSVTTPADRAARELHSTVRSRLGGEIARLRLEHPGRIPVRWYPTGRPVLSPADALGVAGMTLTGDVHQVPEFLRSLPRRQLLVLGPPGAGKSVLATLLAWDLAGAWEQDDPVPVLLSLASWRPADGLRKWMCRRIRELGCGGEAAAELLDQNRVMPLLDGLDELPPALRGPAVEAIDAAVAEGLPLLVTCRGEEYERTVRESGHYLTRAAAVELAPVAPADAIGYLRQSNVAGDRRWEPVFEALRERPDGAVAGALSSPLMLYLARTAYRSGPPDPGELLGEGFATREEIEAHLLERYLPAVYAGPAAAGPPRFGAGRAGRYLTTIARQMRRDATYDFAWWQVRSPVTGPVVAAAFGCAYGWFPYLLFGARQAAFCALVIGLIGHGVHSAVRRALVHVYVTEDVLRGPRAVLRQYALIGFLSALGVATFMAVCVGGWLSLVLDAPAGSVLGFSLLVGGATGAAALLASAWGSYQVSRTWFCLTRRLPWRFWAFLDDAHDLGVLRQTGAVHQFRHGRVQEQLSGGAPASARSARSAYSGRTALRRGKFLLPVLPTAVQALLALGWLLTTGHMNVAGPAEPLALRSGARPDRELVSCDGYCPTAEIWHWKLPQGATERVALRIAEGGGPAFTTWYGLVGARGCAGASVEVTLRLGDGPPSSFVLATGRTTRSELSSKARLPEPVHVRDEPVTLTLRRTDDRPCEVEFSWADAGLRRDGMEAARKLFRVRADQYGRRAGLPSGS
ncbi:NACHT domain-containing protein [Streptomyces sp. NPDC091268]|uniref:NACHT domain-containing protein n=1 Tax=Streptomyces sp. NPDC091268 TaxID=3365979 RepID=UPI0037F33BD4